MDNAPRTPFVLIVEDSRDIAAYFRLVMDLAGYRTEIAANGKSAIEIIFRKLPDIVLLDLSLPGLSGAEILQILRSEPALKKTRPVVITGYSQLAVDLPVEPDLVLYKPVSPGQLTDLVKRLCQDDASLATQPFGKSPWEKTTGLHNRSFFVNRLGAALANLREDCENLFGVLLASLQPGDRPGDKPGRELDELVLREIASALKASVRPTDTIARFGSGQFFILVENISGADTLGMIAERIRPAMGDHPAGGGAFTIGAVLCDDGARNVDEILRDVKIAHGLAKKEGGRRPRIFRHSLLGEANPEGLKPAYAL